MEYKQYSLLKAILFGLIYTPLETNIPIFQYIPEIDYRVFYFLIFLVVNLSYSWRLTFANFFFSMVTEDIFYWIVKAETPYSYAWYYPVIDGIPIIDIIEGIAGVILYMYTPKIMIIMKDCNMWYYFTHGKMHDSYGLLAIIAITASGTLLSPSIEQRAIYLIITIIATGVFVDLWAHCFRH